MKNLTPEQRLFVTERHLATLTTVRQNHSPHVVPVGFTWDQDAGLARVNSHVSSMKVRNVLAWTEQGLPARAALCQVDGGRWITLEGTLRVETDPHEIAEAVRRYAVRYRAPEEDPQRVVLMLEVERVMSSDYMAR